MRIRKLLRIVHRDFGYFIAGMTIIYGLSGIFLNHRHDFNPDYRIFFTEFQTNQKFGSQVSEQEIKSVFETLDRKVIYKKHFINTQGNIKVFIENGEVIINPETGAGTMQYLQKRPLIFEMNKLHKALIGTVWKWMSDAMAAILIIVAVTGVVLLKGKYGFRRWGWWLTAAGFAIPLFFALLNI